MKTKRATTVVLALGSFMLVLLSNLASAASPAEKLLRKSDEWFKSEEASKRIACILSWQSQYGDWPKNKDTTEKPYTGQRSKLRGTFDNSATTGELRVLARAIRTTGNKTYLEAFLKGFDHILRAQYANGGWPQYFPLSKNYHRHITFNDDTMVRVIQFLRDATTEQDFAFLEPGRRTAASQAVEKGIACILKCQVVIKGVPTVWCAQHDAKTLVPVRARSYEHPSLSGSESTGILLLLMSVEAPSPEIIRAVKAGVAWVDAAKIEGFAFRRSESDRRLSRDPKAKPLWARFYELETNRPIFSDRDGVVKYDVQEIGEERRNGYAWYGSWGEKVISTYSKWPHR